MFIVPKNRHSGKNIHLSIKGYYKLYNKKYNFNLEKIINIYEYKPPKEIEQQEYKTLKVSKSEKKTEKKKRQ